MTWRRITKSLVFAGATGVMLLLIMGSSCAGWIMTLEQIRSISSHGPKEF